MVRLTPLEKWSYAIGNMPFSLKDAAFVNFVVFYYTQVEGVSGSLAGLAMFIALIWDAISDPIVGSWSDTVRSRWGRRHPLLLAGGLPTAVMFLALFSPPADLGQTGAFLWLLVTSLLLRTFLTIYYIPYSAMGAELSTDYDERTVIAKARVSMGWLAGMAAPAVALTFVFTANGDLDGRLVRSNYTDYGLLSALVAACTLLFCAWGTRTVIPRLPTASVEPFRFSLTRPISDFRLAARNRNFRVSIGSNLAFGLCAGLYSTLSLYLGTYFWEFSTEQLAGLVVPTALGTLLAFVVLGRLGKRYDKSVLMCASCIGIALNISWILGARLLGLLPDNGEPLVYALNWLSTGAGVFIIVSLQVSSVSLMADILDEYEVDTGLRQEGVFFAASTFIQKATTGLGALVAGVVIDLAGLETGVAPGEVPSAVLQTLGWTTVMVVALFALVAFAFARRIRLGRERHGQLRKQLQERASA